ncbi:MAG: hypothetical protein ACLS26_10320 [Eubacterium sp.]
MNIKKATALLTLTFFLIAVLFGCAKGAEFDNKSNNIAIITKGSDSTFWNDMKNGALSAATECTAVNVTHLKVLKTEEWSHNAPKQND